jgi:hypothetical protein
MASGHTAALELNYRKAYDMFNKEMTVGLFGGSGIQYLQPSWRVVNLGGVTIPQFRKTQNNTAMKIKMCQHDPALNFEKYIMLPKSNLTLKYITTDSTIVNIPSSFESKIKIFSVDWSLLTIGDSPLSDTITGISLATLRMIDHFDAGWPVDEERCGFEVRSRFPYSVEYPVLTKGKIHDTVLVDAVYPVTLGAFLSLATEPGRKHRLVFRTVWDETVIASGLKGIIKRRVNTRSVDHLLLKIPGKFKTTIDMSDTGDSTDHYREHIVSIPPEAITGTTTEFGILGDHLLCDVWLYTE